MWFCVNFFFLINVLCCNFSRICRGFGLISLPSHGSVSFILEKKTHKEKKKTSLTLDVLIPQCDDVIEMAHGNIEEARKEERS